MKKELKLIDRSMLGLLFPTTGSFQQLIIRRDLLKKVTFTQDDLVKYDIKSVEGQDYIEWNELGVTDTITFEFTELECEEIKKGLNILSGKEQLTNDFLGLCDQFLK